MMYSIQIIETEPEEFFDSLNGMSTYNEKYALKKDLRSIISDAKDYGYKAFRIEL